VLVFVLYLAENFSLEVEPNVKKKTNRGADSNIFPI
jgi:hypothetical protein